MSEKTNRIVLVIIVAVSFLIYFKINLDIDKDEKGYKFRKVSKLNRDDLGIRKGKSKRYYELMLKHFKIEKTKLVEKEQPIPALLKNRLLRTKKYLERAPAKQAKSSKK